MERMAILTFLSLKKCCSIESNLLNWREIAIFKWKKKLTNRFRSLLIKVVSYFIVQMTVLARFLSHFFQSIIKRILSNCVNSTLDQFLWNITRFSRLNYITISMHFYLRSFVCTINKIRTMFYSNNWGNLLRLFSHMQNDLDVSPYYHCAPFTCYELNVTKIITGFLC